MKRIPFAQIRWSAVMKTTPYSYFAIWIVTVCLYGCRDQPVQLSYHLPEGNKATYVMEVSSDKSHLSQETEFTVASILKDTLVMNSNVRKADFKSGTAMDEEMRIAYAKFLNMPLYFEMNQQGAILKGLTYTDIEIDASKAFDVKFYFLDYPKEMVTIGSQWTEKRATFDLVFDSIAATYQLRSILPDYVEIHVASEFLGDNQLFTKNISGDYVVDRITGAVLSAELMITGFNGFRGTAGEIKIRKTK